MYRTATWKLHDKKFNVVDTGYMPVSMILLTSFEKSIFEKMVVWFSRITDIRIIPWLLNFQRYAEEFLFAEWRQMKIFQPNRYVNASYEWPILEQFMGKCCPIVSCLDRPKLRHFFNGEELSINTTQKQSKPTKISYKPADFRQILQFTCVATCTYELKNISFGFQI